MRIRRKEEIVITMNPEEARKLKRMMDEVIDLEDDEGQDQLSDLATEIRAGLVALVNPPERNEHNG